MLRSGRWVCLIASLAFDSANTARLQAARRLNPVSYLVVDVRRPLAVLHSAHLDGLSTRPLVRPKAFAELLHAVNSASDEAL